MSATQASPVHSPSPCCTSPASPSTSLDAYVERRCEHNTQLFANPGRRRTPFINIAHNNGCTPGTHSTGVPNTTAQDEEWRQEPITPFHCKETPEVSLEDLARVMRHHCRCSPELLTVGHILMARYELRTGTRVTAHMMHRLFVTCVLVGSKVHCDGFTPNNVFARAVGVPLWELNALEVALLRDLDWRAMVYADAVSAAIANPECIYQPDLHGSALAVDHTLLYTTCPGSPVRSPALSSYGSKAPALSGADAVMDLFGCSTSLQYGRDGIDGHGSLDASSLAPAFIAPAAPPSSGTRGTDDPNLQSPPQPMTQPSPAASDVSSLHSAMGDEQQQLCAKT